MSLVESRDAVEEGIKPLDFANQVYDSVTKTCGSGVPECSDQRTVTEVENNGILLTTAEPRQAIKEGITPVDFASDVFHSLTMLCSDTTAMANDGALLLKRMKESVAPGSKHDARVRLYLTPERIPGQVSMTPEEIEDSFYTARDEYEFIRERERVSRKAQIKKEHGLFIDDSEHYTIRGIEDKSLPVTRRMRRAEHALRVLKEHQDRLIGGDYDTFSRKLHETASKSSQDDAKRAFEIAQQDTLAAMETLVESYVELKTMDPTVLPLLRERMIKTRIELSEKLKSHADGEMS